MSKVERNPPWQAAATQSNAMPHYAILSIALTGAACGLDTFGLSSDLETITTVSPTRATDEDVVSTAEVSATTSITGAPPTTTSSEDLSASSTSVSPTSSTGTTSMDTLGSTSDGEADVFTVIECFDVPTPHYYSGLAYDGNWLWYTVEDGTESVPIKPETGMADYPIPVTAVLHAAQEEDFWTHCSCGGSPDAIRKSKSGTVKDLVRTDVDFSSKIRIRGIAYDSTGHVLYLAGDAGWTFENQLLRVNSDAEPDILLGISTIDFSYGSLRAITWDGLSLWAIIGIGTQTIISIDANNGVVIDAYASPDAMVDWQGIAAIGEDFFLLGSKSNAAVLCRVAL